MNEPLIPPHGGYRKLKSFQIAQLIFDLTVRFCERYVDAKSRTRDQMTQAARSGVQNIAEGSQASGTSKKTELKLTNVARASLEELRLDYEDFLRQRGLHQWMPDHPVLMRFKARRCRTLEQVREWVEEEKHGQTRTNTDEQGPARAGRNSKDELNKQSSENVGGGPCTVSGSPRSSTPRSSELVANAALSLLNIACHLLDRQLAAQAAAFEQEGGFTERLYRVRNQRRSGK